MARLPMACSRWCFANFLMDGRSCTTTRQQQNSCTAGFSAYSTADCHPDRNFAFRRECEVEWRDLLLLAAEQDHCEIVLRLFTSSPAAARGFRPAAYRPPIPLSHCARCLRTPAAQQLQAARAMAPASQCAPFLYP